VVIMQRLHEGDVSGAILDKQLGYDHVMLPMRFDPVRARPTLLGIEDPRQEAGELLFPARFPQEVVDRDSKVMGPYATAGQFQQEPTPRGGGVIKPGWWETWMEESYPPFDYIIASIDTAYTTKTENDFSAMTVWGVFSGDVGTMRAEAFVNARGQRRNNAEEAARFDEGVKIRDMLDADPDNTRSEFKRLMGTAQALDFPAAKKQLKPEELSAEVLKSLRADVQEQFGIAYLFIAHDLAVVEHISDHVLVMHHGKIVESASAEAIYNDPQNEYTKTLLSAVPSIA
jgi:hypothetical protein